MALSTQLTATLAVNTLGGSNQPAPTDSFLSTISAGTSFQGPIAIAVPATGSTVLAVPGGIAASNTYSHIVICNTGVAGAPNILLDMKSVGANSSQMTISAGGRVYFFGLAHTPGATAAYCNPTIWTLASATAVATTASVYVVYA